MYWWTADGLRESMQASAFASPRKIAMSGFPVSAQLAMIKVA
jgi:hypothetical protein